MPRFLLFILLLLPFCGFAQESKARLLTAQDPILGLWEFIPDSAGQVAPNLMFEDDECGVLVFKAGEAQSYTGLYIDTLEGSLAIAGPSYYVAKTDGKKIYGVCGKTIFVGHSGEKFEFAYRYDKAKDQLIVTRGGQSFTYRRSRLEPW